MLKSLSSGILDSHGRPVSDECHLIATWREGQLWAEVFEKIEQWLKWGVATSAAGLLLGIVLLANAQWLFAAIVLVGTGLGGWFCLFRARQLRPASKVRSVSRMYWAGSTLPLEGRMALYDLSGCYPARDVALQEIRDADRLSNLEGRLRELFSDLEVMEPVEEHAVVQGRAIYGIDARLFNCLQDLESALSDVVEHTVEVPAVPASDPLFSWLETLFPHMAAEDVRPVVGDPVVADVRHVNSRIEGLYQASRDDANVDIDETLDVFRGYLDNLAQQIDKAFDESEQVLEGTAVTSLFTAYAPSWATYCPRCNPDDDGEFRFPDQTLMKFEPVEENASSGSTALLGDSLTLRCGVCGHQSRSSLDLVRHEAELFRPVWDQIMAACQDQIRSIDREIEKELDQLKKERELEVRKLRSSTRQDQRKRVAKLREFSSRAAILRAQVVGTTTALAKYQKISERRRREFAEYAHELERSTAQRAAEAESKLRAEFAERQAQADEEQMKIVEINRAEAEKKEARLLEKLSNIERNTGLTEAQKHEMQESQGVLQWGLDQIGLSRKQEIRDRAERAKESW